MYWSDWDLKDSSDFTDLSTIGKFSEATQPHEKLSLFNPIHIRRLAVDGHISAVEAAVAIPAFLILRMIQCSVNDEIDVFTIGDGLSERRVNSVILSFNRYEPFNMKYRQTCGRGVKHPCRIEWTWCYWEFRDHRFDRAPPNFVKIKNPYNRCAQGQVRFE